MASQDDFFEVDLNKVEMPELDPDWQSSHSYSRQQMDQWLAELQEIQRLYREEGYRSSDFQKMLESTDPALRALGETHRNFYDARTNGDGIVLDWRNDHYEIINGRHRVSLAKTQGLRHLPARVTAPDDVTLSRLKDEGSRIAAADESRSRQPWERHDRPQRPGAPSRERK